MRTKYTAGFDEARKLYPGSKKGLKTEFSNFVYRSKHPIAGKPPFNYVEVLPLLKPAIEHQIVWRQADGRYWKNFQTWINQLCWEEEAAKRNEVKTNHKIRLFPISGKICSKDNCHLPAVYKNSTGGYDWYYCSKHLPKDVKELYE